MKKTSNSRKMNVLFISEKMSERLTGRAVSLSSFTTISFIHPILSNRYTSRPRVMPQCSQYSLQYFKVWFNLRQARNHYLRHRLIDRLYSVTHCKLIYNFLSRVLVIDLPGFIAFRRRQRHHPNIHFAQMMEQIFVKTSVLYVIRRNLDGIKNLCNFGLIWSK